MSSIENTITNLYLRYNRRNINRVSEIINYFNKTNKAGGTLFKEQVSAVAIIKTANKFPCGTHTAEQEKYMLYIIEKKCRQYIMNNCRAKYLALLRYERRDYLIYSFKRLLKKQRTDYVCLKNIPFIDVRKWFIYLFKSAKLWSEGKPVSGARKFKPVWKRSPTKLLDLILKGKYVVSLKKH